MHESDDTEDAFAHQKLVEAVENQLAANQPEAAQATLNMLALVGYSREDSLDLMAQVLAHRISVMLDSEEPFDLDAYERELRRLPRLPGEEG